MSVDSEPAHLEQQEEVEIVEVEEEVDAPAHHPYAPPDEVTITASFFICFLISLVLYCFTIYIWKTHNSNKTR